MLKKSRLQDLFVERGFKSTNSQEYQKILSEKKLEEAVIKLRPYTFPNEELDFDLEEDSPFLQIDKNIALKIENIFKKYSVNISTNDVCFILKKAFIDKSLSEINSNVLQQDSDFKKEFLELYKKTANKEFIRVQFLGRQKDNYIRIQDPYLISNLIKLIRQHYFKDDGAFFIANLLIGNNNNREKRVKDYYKDITTIKIIRYFLCEGDVFDNIKEQTMQSITVSNDQARIVHELLIAGYIIEDDVPEIRTVQIWLKRLIQGRIELFKKATELDEDYWLENSDELIDKMNELDSSD